MYATSKEANEVFGLLAKLYKHLNKSFWESGESDSEMAGQIRDVLANYGHEWRVEEEKTDE